QMGPYLVHVSFPSGRQHPQRKPEGPIPGGNEPKSRKVGPGSEPHHRNLEDRRGGLPSLPEALLAATILRAGTAHTSPRSQCMRSAHPPHRTDYVGRYVFSPTPVPRAALLARHLIRHC